MMQYVMKDDDNRICVIVDNKEYTDDSYIAFDFPDDFDFLHFMDYKIVNGELVYDKRPVSPESEVMQLKNKLAETDYVIPKMMEAQLTGISLQPDEQARYSEIIEQRKEWRARINELEPLLEPENMQDSTV